MVFKTEFDLVQYVPEIWTPPDYMVELWEKHYLDSVLLTLKKLEKKAPDDGTFIRDITGPSTNAYADYLNPGFIARSERSVENIRSTREANLSGSFRKWRENLILAISDGNGGVSEWLKARVAAAKAHWVEKVSKGSLRFTGDKIRGRSVAPVAAFFLVGDPRATSWVSPTEQTGGLPYNITRERQRNGLKASIIQRLVQGGMMIVNAGTAGGNEMPKQNGLNASFLNGQRDPTKCAEFATTADPDKCYCLWEKDQDSRLILHIRVGKMV